MCHCDIPKYTPVDLALISYNHSCSHCREPVFRGAVAYESVSEIKGVSGIHTNVAFTPLIRTEL